MKTLPILLFVFYLVACTGTMVTVKRKRYLTTEDKQHYFVATCGPCNHMCTGKYSQVNIRGLTLNLGFSKLQSHNFGVFVFEVSSHEGHIFIILDDQKKYYLNVKGDDVYLDQSTKGTRFNRETGTIEDLAQSDNGFPLSFNSKEMDKKFLKFSTQKIIYCIAQKDELRDYPFTYIYRRRIRPSIADPKILATFDREEFLSFDPNTRSFYTSSFCEACLFVRFVNDVFIMNHQEPEKISCTFKFNKDETLVPENIKDLLSFAPKKTLTSNYHTERYSGLFFAPITRTICTGAGKKEEVIELFWTPNKSLYSPARDAVIKISVSSKKHVRISLVTDKSGTQFEPYEDYTDLVAIKGCDLFMEFGPRRDAAFLSLEDLRTNPKYQKRVHIPTEIDSDDPLDTPCESLAEFSLPITCDD